MDSIELEIRITGLGGRRFRASVVNSPTGSGGSRVFELPDQGELSPAAGDWRDLRRPAAPRDKSARLLLHEQGLALFKLIFQGDVLLAFDSAYRLARQREAWFRLQFSFDFAPEAVNLPWEGLIGPEGWPLARLDKISIERRLVKPPGIEVARPSVPGKIRVLVVGASPRDQERLDLRKEIRWIKAALRGVAEVVELRDATEAKLGQALTEEPGFDVVHFLGHGDFEGEEGALWLLNETGDGERLTSAELPFVLRQPVPFVFLNVCHGGRSSSNPFAGLAEGLIRSGVRAVVAMRREISDRGAQKLAKIFYGETARSETLTRSLAKARREVDTAQCDWAVPMLFLTGEDFALLPPSQAPEPPPPPPRPPRPRWPWIVLIAFAVAALALVYLGTRDPEPEVEPVVPADDRCPSPSELDFSFIYVAPGSFDQGSDKVEEERPVHRVTLTQPYCLAAFELTRSLYDRIVGSQPPQGMEAHFPVERLTWNEARQLVDKLATLYPEAGFRLPTSAEWEFAARAGRPGDEDEDVVDAANCLKREKDRYLDVSAVGSFPPNAWGFYDMKGNVWEWVADWEAPYGKEAAVDPAGPADGEKKIRRGGSYKNNAKNCRYSTRAGVLPDREQEAAGMRIARSPVSAQN